MATTGCGAPVDEAAGSSAEGPTIAWGQAPDDCPYEPIEEALNSREIDAADPSIAIGPDGHPVVAFREGKFEQSDVLAKRWDGSRWIALGAPVDSPAAVDTALPRVVVSSEGVTFLAWVEVLDTEKAELHVAEWHPETSSWVHLGGALNVAARARVASASIALGAGALPIVAFAEQVPGEFDGAAGTYVKRWTGTSWELLGGDTACCEGVTTGDTSLAVSPDLQRIVVAGTQADAPEGLLNEVIKVEFDGSGWSPLGNLTSHTSHGPSIAFHGDGRPILAAEAHDYTGSVWVYDLDDVTMTWASLGEGIEKGTAHPVIAVAPDGRPILAVSPDRVFEWDGGSWVEDCASTFMAASDLSLALDDAGDPWMALVVGRVHDMAVGVVRIPRGR